jgi:hypothetical protein
MCIRLQKDKIKNIQAGSPLGKKDNNKIMLTTQQTTDVAISSISLSIV